MSEIKLQEEDNKQLSITKFKNLSEVLSSIFYLKEKREKKPYMNKPGI
jgi:hypothetical protein